MTATQACSSVASSTGLKSKDVTAVVASYMTVEEERVLQVRRCIELEIEEEGCDGSSQGHQPFHQGAMRLQGKACFQDSEGPRSQEIQGPCQLVGLENYPSRTKP